MSGVSGRGLRPGGVIRAFGRLVLLLGFGFAAGLIFGVLTEEPELLVGHLRGEGTSVVLAATGSSPSEVIAANRTESANSAIAEQAESRRAVVDHRRERESDRLLPAVAAPREKRDSAAADRDNTPSHRSTLDGGTNGVWAIQVGAFSDESAASRLAEGLNRKGYRAEVLSGKAGQSRWRVRVQPIRGEGEAKGMATRLKHEEQLPTWLIRMDGVSP